MNNIVAKAIELIDDVIVSAKLQKYVEQLEAEIKRQKQVIDTQAKIIRRISNGG